MNVREKQSSEKRLIDANALIKEANTDGAYGYVDAKQIADAPTIDAVEVVRCRDCKHWDAETWFCDNHSTFDHHGLDWNMFSEDDFCSYGERKDGDWNG